MGITRLVPIVRWEGNNVWVVVKQFSRGRLFSDCSVVLAAVQSLGQLFKTSGQLPRPTKTIWDRNIRGMQGVAGCVSVYHGTLGIPWGYA